MGRVPWCTLGFVCAALFVSFGPGAETLRARLWLEPEAFAAGEVWRAFTAPLVHGWVALAVCDLGAIAAIGTMLERRARRDVALTLPLAALLSAAAVLLLRGDLSSFSGSSALASGLFVLLALRLRQDRATSRVLRRLSALALGLFAAKLVLELAGIWPSPAGLVARGVESVSVAHVAGALAGLLVSRWPPDRRLARSPIRHGVSRAAGAPAVYE